MTEAFLRKKCAAMSHFSVYFLSILWYAVRRAVFVMTAPMNALPEGGGTMRITCDLHMHSALSPCAMEDMTPNNMVNMALLEELTAIAITDHNSCENVGAIMRVARGSGLVIIPGMEVQTREDVHMVTLFADLDAAMAMQQQVYGTLPPFRASAKQQAKQLLLDEEDEVVGHCSMLLNMSCGFSVEEVVRLAASLDGIAIPAHIDRKSFSMCSQLGFVPPNLPVTNLEVSMFADAEQFRREYPAYRILTDSDAHELGHIGLVRNELDVETVSAHGIIKALAAAIG